MKKYLIELHQSIFSESAQYFYFSPGRVNLIGEHTDYSGGYVLPISIDLGIYAAISTRDDASIYVYSHDFKDLGILNIQKPFFYQKNRSYVNYIEGVLWVLEKENMQIRQGFNITLFSTLPKSAGLSSSASLEVLILTLLNERCELNLSKLDIVRLAKRVENDYIGVSSGIMDQFIIAFGKKNHAILLDTESLDFDYIPIDLDTYALVLMNTNKARDLVDSAYNTRFKSIEEAKKIFDQPLGKINYSMLESKKNLINDEVWKRFKHVVTENKRTLDAKEALKEHDYESLGFLMRASHKSLKNDFEVSCYELDYLVTENMKLGALGARMTGAGFGGTMLALYEKKKIPTSFDILKERYFKRFNLNLELYIAVSEDGTKSLGGEF
ncbi:MAG: galactokinase [Acholeplasmataceae bacterium]